MPTVLDVACVLILSFRLLRVHFSFFSTFALGDDLEDMTDSAEALEVSREGLYDQLSTLRLNSLDSLPVLYVASTSSRGLAISTTWYVSRILLS